MEHLRARPTFELRTHDVTEDAGIEGSVDLVLHLAAIASPPAYTRFPIETLLVGTIGTKNMLDLARGKGARFLFTSTSEVYGDPLVHPQSESYWGNVNPIGERAVYDESKRCGEALVLAYHRVHGVDTRIVRIFNTYGPRMRRDDGRAVPSFLAQAVAGEPVTVNGDGSQTRSLCYVDDLVDGIFAVLERGDALPYNLGNPEEIAMIDLARTIIRLATSPSTIVHRPLPTDDPKRRRPVIDRARALGWEPRVSLEDGLRRTLQAVEPIAPGHRS